MKKTNLLWIILVVVGLLITGCFETTDPNPGTDDASATELANAGFELLKVKLIAIEETGAEFTEADYNEIRDLFEQALEANPDNALANLGMSIAEIASINYDDELWALISDFSAELGDGRVFNNQFNLLSKIPLLYTELLNKSLREGDISFARVQDFIDDNVLPKLESALSHLEHAVTLAEEDAIIIETGEESLELDCGEIYLFRATVHAVCAFMRTIALYDVDMFDENGTYDWIHDMNENNNDYGYDAYSYDSETKTLYVENHYGATQNDSLLVHVIKYNYVNRPGFFNYRPAHTPAAIGDDLVGILADLQNSVDYISNETDDQTNDIIPFSFIASLNGEIAASGPDMPNFAQEWESIDDVISWLNNFITAPVNFVEDFNGDGTDEEFTVDMSRLFDPGMGDLKQYVPYHRWRPEEEWITEQVYETQWNNGGGTFSFWCQDEYIEIDNVDTVVERNYENNFYPIELLDGPDGNVINPEEVFPYFPDYTLNGLFPGMDRDKWFQLFGRAE